MTFRGQIPANADTVTKISASLPDGGRVDITRFRASARRSTPMEWISVVHYDAAGEKTGRWRRQYTGAGIDKLPGELAETVRMLRDEEGAVIEGAPADVEPAEASAPEWCEHCGGQPGCSLATCQGVPAAPVVLDRNVETVTEEPRGYETGVVTAGRALAQALRELTGAEVTLPRFADNGYLDVRKGVRKAAGWDFTAAGHDVRVLSYESRPPMQRAAREYGAVYFDGEMVAGDVDLCREIGAWTGQVARLLVPHIERAVDADTLAQPVPDGGWLLKCPPVGGVVDDALGRVEVLEVRNGGGTLIVRDGSGREQYLDRAAAGWWTVYPAAKVATRPEPDPALATGAAGAAQGEPDRGQIPAAVTVGSSMSREVAGCPVCGDTVRRGGYAKHAKRHLRAGETPPDGVPAIVNTPAELAEAVARLRAPAETGVEVSEQARAFAASVDRTDGELDAAVLAHRATPTQENQVRVMAAMRRHVDALFAEERAELMALQNGGRAAVPAVLVDKPQPEPVVGEQLAPAHVDPWAVLIASV